MGESGPFYLTSVSNGHVLARSPTGQPSGVVVQNRGDQGQSQQWVIERGEEPDVIALRCLSNNEYLNASGGTNWATVGTGEKQWWRCSNDDVTAPQACRLSPVDYPDVYLNHFQGIRVGKGQSMKVHMWQWDRAWEFCLTWYFCSTSPTLQALPQSNAPNSALKDADTEFESNPDSAARIRELEELLAEQAEELKQQRARLRKELDEQLARKLRGGVGKDFKENTQPKEQEIIAIEQPKEQEVTVNEEPKKQEVIANEEPKKQEVVTNEQPKKQENKVTEQLKKQKDVTIEQPKKQETKAPEQPKKKETKALEQPKKPETKVNKQPKKQDVIPDVKPKKQEPKVKEAPKKQNTKVDEPPKKKETKATKQPRKKQDTIVDEKPKKQEPRTSEKPKKQDLKATEQPTPPKQTKKQESKTNEKPKKKPAKSKQEDEPLPIPTTTVTVPTVDSIAREMKAATCKHIVLPPPRKIRKRIVGIIYADDQYYKTPLSAKGGVPLTRPPSNGSVSRAPRA